MERFADRRAHPRATVTFPCKLYQPRAGKFIAGATLNLSGFGALVDISRTAFFEAGERLRVGISGDAAEVVLPAAELREAHVAWTGAPSIVLDLELRPGGVTVYFALTLTAKHASVQVNYVAFDQPSADPTDNNAFLEAALEKARIRRSEPASVGK